MEDTWDQRLPEGGWPVYAAGTNFVTVSKQLNVGLATDGNGCIDTAAGTGNITGFYNGANDLYSTFELMVPDGVYVIRLASHWCSYRDKLAKGFCYDLSGGTAYQKTSTNVWGVYDANGIWIEQKEITVTVSGGDVYIGDFVVMDLAPPAQIRSGADTWQPIGCYLYDGTANPLGQGNTDINSQTYQGVSVEKALVDYGIASAGTGTYETMCTSDHNGFWFGIAGKGGQEANTFDITVYQVGASPGYSILAFRLPNIFVGTLTQLFEKTLEQINFSGPSSYSYQLVAGCITTQVPWARQRCSTILDGQVEDSLGNLVQGALAIYQSGRVGESQQNGDLQIVAWGDMVTPNVVNFGLPPQPNGALIQSDGSRIVDNVVVNLSPACLPIYPNGQIISGIFIFPFAENSGTNPPPYSPTAKYPLPDFIVDEQNAPSIKARKRGGNYTDVIRLSDVAGRQSTCIRAYELYIPFVTEDIGKYGIEDFSGVVYPPNTFRYGKPLIKWVLAANTVFPSWVSTIQWMRTKNSIYGRYLQFVANQVTYLSATAQGDIPEIQTSFLNADAVAIKVSLTNIIDYKSQNPDSFVSYTYQAGDRFRLIYDRSVTPINGINDFEITSYDSTTQSILLKTEGFAQPIQSGTLFEIFNPKSVATEDEQIYYEVGEVVNVVNGIPAQFSGVFTNGDTYWRSRVMIVNDDATKFTSAYYSVIEDASISDFYLSEAQDIGRIGIIDNNFREVRRPMLLKASNQFIPSTAINGLSSFEALNEKELDRNSGAIKMLVSVNQTVVAVSTLRETSNYIQVVTFQQATQGQGVLAIADQFFGTQYPHSKTLGTDLPATIVTNDSKIWGWINQRANVWKYKGDGEDTISDLKMINYFQGLQQDGVTDAVATYYRYTKEYIITLWRKYQYEVTGIISITPEGRIYLVSLPFVNGTPLPKVGENITVQCLLGGVWVNKEVVVNTVDVYPDGTAVTFSTVAIDDFNNAQQLNVVYSLPETIAWFDGEGGERWVTFYSFTPEAYSMIGSELMAFKDGEPWVQDKNPAYNNFFGVQYDTRVTPVFNLNPEFLKVWNTVVLQTKQDNNACDWSVPVITNDNNQLSRLNKAGWVKKGETFYAPFKRDLNDLTVAPNLRISQGRALRSSTLTCEMINDYNGEMSLYLWSANVTNSERTSK